MRTVEIDAAHAGARLDKALSDLLADVSRSRLKTLIEEGCVTVHGEIVREPRRAVAPGQTVTIALPVPKAAAPIAQAMPLAIVHEDDALIVIDKPAGMTVHPGAGQADGTLVNALLAHCAGSLSGIGGVARPGIVHRLDKETSGLLVVAKTDAAHQGLSEQFAAHGRDGRMVREYLALVWGEIGRMRSVDAAVGRAPHHRTKMAVVLDGRQDGRQDGRHGGRHAVTHVRTESILAGGLVSAVACTLETGRTHQIRVHLSHVGHPLLGDAVYGQHMATKAARLSDEARGALQALGRQALHARTLGFEHPMTGEAMRFEAPPPDPLARLIEAITRM